MIYSVDDSLPKVVDEQFKRAYETLLKCREIDLNALCTRANIALVAQAALVAFVARSVIEIGTDKPYSNRLGAIILSSLGVIVSLVCTFIVRGSYFWISYWEYRLKEIEPKVLPAIPIFADHPSARNVERVRELKENGLRYVSSRRPILLLFNLLVLFWFCLLVFVLVR